MQKNNIFEEKLDILYSCIKRDGGIIDLCWCGNLLYPYYKHFNDTNEKYKVGSLLAFWGLLLDWEDRSGFPFYRDNIDEGIHDFKRYLEVFLDFGEEIKNKYPATYETIMSMLIDLDKEENFEEVFTYIDMELIKRFRDTTKEIEYEFNNGIYIETGGRV